jgi:hypothetical protein
MEGENIQLTDEVIDSVEKTLFTFCAFADQVQGKNFKNNSYLEILIKDVKLILKDSQDAQLLFQVLDRKEDNNKKIDTFWKISEIALKRIKKIEAAVPDKIPISTLGQNQSNYLQSAPKDWKIEDFSHICDFFKIGKYSSKPTTSKNGTESTYTQSINTNAKSEEQKNQMDQTIFLTEEEIKNALMEQEKKSEEHLKIHKKNQNDYYKQRDDILKKYNGKYIVFENNKVLDISDLLDTLLQKTKASSTAYITWVGHEDFKLSKNDILLTSDLKVGSKTSFPYHAHKQKFVREGSFGITSGLCGINRPFISLVLKYDKKYDYGVVTTFLINTQAPITLIQPKIIQQMKLREAIDFPTADNFFYLGGVQAYCSAIYLPTSSDQDDRFVGINVLGMNYLRKVGFQFKVSDECSVDIKTDHIGNITTDIQYQ